MDDCGTKYSGNHTALDLINVLKVHHVMETDCTGSLYCGITLKWNYEQRYVDIFMLSYVKNCLM